MLKVAPTISRTHHKSGKAKAIYFLLIHIMSSNTRVSTSTSNIQKPVSVILADPKHVHPNVETFQDSRTLVKVIANYCKVDQANIVNAINRTEIAAEKTNYLQNMRANLASTY